MASSAFKSTTKRTQISTSSSGTEDSPAGSSSSKAHRRSRSLSRFSHSFEPTADDERTPAAPKGKFVNTVRGSGFPEISLDDLAIEFFSLKDERESAGEIVHRSRGRSARGASEIGHWASETASSRRRGRSVSRQSSSYASAKNGVSEANLRRRRSLSAVRSRISDSESHSSAITDDEMKDGPYGQNVIEKTIRAVYSRKKADHPTEDAVNNGFYEAMRKELRHAVKEIRTELEQVMERKYTGNCLESQAFAATRKSYTEKLEESEKRKQDLLAEIVLEEQRGQELSKIVRELCPDSKHSAVGQRLFRARKTSDRNRMSTQLTEEAEKYFEDFITNVKDTDISSYDGERSDASSNSGEATNLRDASTSGEILKRQSPASNSHPFELEGVSLPWLQWETSTDGSVPSKNNTRSPVTPKILPWNTEQDPGCYSVSSHGSWSPGMVNGLLKNMKECDTPKSEVPSPKSQFDMNDYKKLQKNEDILLDMYRERLRISSGGFLLCSRAL